MIGSLANQVGGGGDTEAPTAPTNLEATAVNRQRVDLTWSASTDNVAVVSYQVFRDGALLDTVATTTYSDTTAEPATTYSYTVFASDAAGNSSSESESSEATTPANAVPVWSTVPDQELIVGDAFLLNLNNFCTDADADEVEYSIVSGALPAGVQLSEFQIVGTPSLSGGATVVTVRADDGFTVVDTTIEFTTNDTDATPPPVPTALNAISAATDRIDLTWDASVDVAGSEHELVSGTQDYLVYRSTDGVNFSLRATVTQASYSDGGLAAGTTYHYKVSARDAALNESALSAAVFATTTVDVDTWPLQPAGTGLHAIPGINIWGSTSFGGSGRNTAGVDVVLINNSASTDTISAVTGLGANTYEGTFEGFMRFANGNRSKIGIFNRSGLWAIQKQMAAPQGNMSLWGQFAPAPGIFLRGARAHCTGDHGQVWHVHLYMGDDAAGAPLEQRDCWTLGSSAISEDWLFVNCDMAWSIDELFEAYNTSNRIGFIACAFHEPLHATAHPDLPAQGPSHGFGPLLGGGGGESGRFSVERCVFAQSQARNPWIGSRYSTIANIIVYNAGFYQGGAGTAVQYNNQFGHPGACLHNIANSMFVRGPENNGTMVTIKATGADAFPSGSGVYITGCVQNGWSNPSTQAGMLTSTVTNFGIFSSARTLAMPVGRLSNFTDTKSIALNPQSPTTAERIAFLDLIEDTIGPLPSHRSLSYGRLQLTLNRIRARLNGTTGEALQFVSSVPEAGGWFSVPSVTVNPTSPGAHWHAPMPTAASRHTPLLVGSFSNGMSAIGYTPMEVWAIEQHWFVGGK